MGAWLYSALLSPVQSGQGREGGACHCSYVPPALTHISARKETPLVAALMAYTWLEDVVEKGPGVGEWSGEQKGFNCCPPQPSACLT